MTKSFAEITTESRRLSILRLLAAAPGYSANSSILQDLLENYAHRASRDTVHTDMAWLAEQGLIEVEDLKALKIALLKSRGLDVARGVAFVPGVKRPSPAL